MHIKSFEHLQQLHKDFQKKAANIPRKILVCLGPGCLAAGSERIYEVFAENISKSNIKGLTVEAVKKTGCHGLCAQGPLVSIEPDGLFYTKVQAKSVPEIIEKTLQNNETVSKLLYSAPDNGHKIERWKDDQNLHR